MEAIDPVIPNLASIIKTATSVCSLVYPSTVDTPSSLPTTLSSLASLPSPPIAVAALVLSIEAELRRPLPQHAILAEMLGVRVGAGKAAVMQRYKLISDAVLIGVESVPWLAKHEKKKTRGGGAGRSKVAKATVAVQGLKDVLSFWEDIWRSGVEGRGRLALDVDEDEDVASYSGDESVGSTLTTSTGSERSARSLSSLDASVVGRKRKRGSRRLAQASQYLLNPLSSPLPPLHGPSGSTSTNVSRAVAGGSDMLSPAHLLTAHVASLSAPPTRLQILAMERGGEEDVGDEELFEEGELDSFLRTDEEVEVVKRMMDLGFDDGREREPASKKRRKEGGGTTRIDVDRLAALLAEPADEEDEAGPEVTWPADGDTEEVSEWRPLSPDPGGFMGDVDVSERYDF